MEEGDGRRFELSFSSETPVRRAWGLEILDHSGECVDLTRLLEFGTVLFNHDAGRPIGRILDVSVENGRGAAVVEIDDDEDSELIRSKMAIGTLRGVSVGYIVDAWEDVRAGRRSEDGRFEGPCSIARRWYPYEVSIVSVPADATVGVGRVLETDQVRRALNRRIYEFNRNLIEQGGKPNG